MSALIDQYSEQELRQIVSQSHCIREIIDKLGYSTHSGSNRETVKSRINKYQIDISHFTYQSPIERTKENIFIENSTASQQTLRRWYVKGKYTPYICSICGQEPIWQGKDLTLILDHINGNNHDDRLENLRWVCPNCNQQLDTTGTKNIKKQNINSLSNSKKYYCIDCGKEITHHSIRCTECENKHRIIPLEKMPITREELKELIRTIPFTTIASQFGVTDNAIRKWCDKFNLPRKKKEINSYSDEEWANI